MYGDKCMTKRVTIKKAPICEGDIVKISQSHPKFKNKIGVVGERITDCDDCNVQAWMVRMGEVQDIIWADDMRKIST